MKLNQFLLWKSWNLVAIVLYTWFFNECIGVAQDARNCLSNESMENNRRTIFGICTTVLLKSNTPTKKYLTNSIFCPRFTSANEFILRMYLQGRLFFETHGSSYLCKVWIFFLAMASENCKCRKNDKLSTSHLRIPTKNLNKTQCILIIFQRKSQNMEWINLFCLYIALKQTPTSAFDWKYIQVYY